MPQSDKSCLITGAGGGIGAALVEAYEAAGWNVISTDRVPVARNNHIVSDLSCWIDATNEVGSHLIEDVRQLTKGSLTSIVHNAAHQVVTSCDKLTSADWQQTLSTNLLAPFWITMAFRVELESNQGSIVAISSIHERLTKPGFVAYATSKAAMSGMIRALAVDLGGRIRCNAICPAAIATPMLLAGFEQQPEAYRQLESYHPIGRIGLPQEVAQTALFLSSRAAEFINSACLDISGGISARLHDPV